MDYNLVLVGLLLTTLEAVVVAEPLGLLELRV
jgi:hypothetical protein